MSYEYVDIFGWEQAISAEEAGRLAQRLVFYECGISRKFLDELHEEQRGESWCWAAAVSAVLRFYGITATQEEIVLRTFGRLVDEPADLATMAARLNGWGPNRDGMLIAIYAQFFLGRPSDDVLLHELQAWRRPLILARRGPDVGHVMLATAVQTDGRRVHEIIVRDPAEPMSIGRRPLRRDEDIEGYFVIRAFTPRERLQSR